MHKIFIGVPCNRLLKPKMVESLLGMVKNTDYEFKIATEGYTTAENRTYLIIQAIKAKCTHILFIDDDMIFPADTLKQLLSHEKEVVGVVANSRALPLMPVVEFLDDDTISTGDKLLGKREIPTELFEAKAVGGGVLLIDLKVFDKIEKPWFSTEVYDFGMTRVGEDSWFCYRARKAGYKIYCDPTIKIGHLGDFIY